jgi:hypothetical protein
MAEQGAMMQEDGAAGTDTDALDDEGPVVDRAIIEQLASITDSEGFSVLGELLNAFLAAVPVRLATLDRAHALTGSAASFGARGMAALCRELRVAATDGDGGTVADLARAVHGEFTEVRAWLVDFRSAV